MRGSAPCNQALERAGEEQAVRARDPRCTTPGCSRRSRHSHHLEFRSRGGSDDPANQAGECGHHHLDGIHGGHIEVTGTAPDRLTWKVGGRIWRDAGFGRGPDGQLLPLEAPEGPSARRAAGPRAPDDSE